MITFKELTLRNFLSYGNNTTSLKLDFTKPTLIVGKNYDSVVNGQVDSNGSGKSAILNAISFCLYDKTISNIEKSDVVNYINGKNMEVSLTFVKDNINYKIERYRKNKAKGGDGVRIFVNPTSATFEKEHDKTPDSIANANREIERILGIPFDIFARIVVFTASYEPFLSLPSSHASKANQRDIIEELFGLTELTRKAEKLKELISETKQALKAASEKNSRIESERNRYQSQLDSTLQKLSEWEASRKEQSKALKASAKKLLAIDIDFITEVLDKVDELNAKKAEIAAEIKLINANLSAAVANNRQMKAWEISKTEKVALLEKKLAELSAIDVAALTKVAEDITRLNGELTLKRTQQSTILSKLKRLNSDIAANESEIEHLSNSKCPYCKQDYPESVDKLKACEDMAEKLSNQRATLSAERDLLVKDIESIEGELESLLKINIPRNLKSIESETLMTKGELDALVASTNPFTEQDTFKFDALLFELNESLSEVDSLISKEKSKLVDIEIPVAGYSEWSRAAINKVDSEINRIADKIRELKSQDNPFDSVAKELEFTLENEIEKVNTTVVDELYAELEHQEFLLKLLTKKDSFVRKALLNKNIPFLNSRLAHYLDAMGLNHKVLFTEEMGAKITQFGTEYSFENLSAGQKARINLALSFAFRDVLQARFSKINFCILDECLDVGLGNVGVQLAAKMIKSVAVNDKLSMFVISHRDEIASMFDSKLEVELRDGFSSIKKSSLSSTQEEVE